MTNNNSNNQPPRRPATRGGTNKGETTVPATGKRGQAERDSAAVRVSGLHSRRQK